MIVKSLTVKNFGSYGNKPQTVLFTEGCSINLIAAKNGSGKTTLINALRFVLYGKTGELKLSDMINRINKKGALVTVELEVQNKQIKIERGISPSILNVEVDGIKLTYAGKSNIQAFIEDEILKLPFSVFSNLISLSMADFKSFIDMTPADKRNIVDKMFGFDVVNDINKKLKEKRKAVDAKSITITLQVNEKVNTIKRVEERMASLTVDSTDYNSINEGIKKSIDELKTTYESEKTKLKTLHDKKGTVESGLRDINHLFQEHYTRYKSAEEKLKLYANKKCPTCGSNLESEEHLHVKVRLEEIKSEEEIQCKSLKEQSNKNKELLEKANSFLLQINKSVGQIESNIRNLSNEIVQNEKRAHNDVENIKKQFISQIEEIQNDIDQLNTENNGIAGEVEFYKLMIDGIFSDNGVKSVLAKQILYPLNRLISNYVDYFEFDKHIEFNDNFDVIVKHLGSEISPKTLSLGERKISDLILIMSFIELIKLQYPKLNVMFLDELFSSLDMDNIKKVTAMLIKIANKYNFNLFVVAHAADLEIQNFDRVLNITKSNGFAKITEQIVK